MDNKIFYIGCAVAIIAGVAYLYFTNKGGASTQYDYQIYNEGNVTNALNLHTNQIDYSGDPKTTIETTSKLGKILIKAGAYPVDINLSSNAYISGEGNSTILRSINLTNASDCNIQNFKIKDSLARGLEIHNGSRNLINNFSIENTQQEGVMVAKRSNEISQYNKITNFNIIKTGNHGVVSTGADYTTIQNGIVQYAGKNFTSGFAHGIAVDGNSGTDPCTGCIVDHITAKNSYDAGIEIADAANYCTISNNYVEKTGIGTNSTAGYGIYYGGGLAPSHNGKILFNIVNGAITNGIELDNASYVDVNDNESYNNDYGIREFSNCSYNSFNRNNNHNNRIANELLEGTNHRN